MLTDEGPTVGSSNVNVKRCRRSASMFLRPGALTAWVGDSVMSGWHGMMRC